MKKLVIFDLDGTLLNTISDLGNACNHALEQMGFSPHPLSAYNYMVGNGVRKLMERAEPDADSVTIDKLLAEFRAYYDDHCTDLTRPYPGIPELLSTLVSHGVAVAVTSNKYQAAVTKIINHHFPEIPFVAALGEVSGRPKKPDPCPEKMGLGLCLAETDEEIKHEEEADPELEYHVAVVLENVAMVECVK